jgi:hypothetical protein
MLPEKRNAALTIILGKLSPKGGEKAEDKPCADCGKTPCECDDTGRETAMGELISAFRAGDAKAACAAWDAVCELTPAPGDAAEEESADEEEDDE